LRDLDLINIAASSTKRIFIVSLIIPIFMGCGAWALATGAAPNLPLTKNYLEIISLIIITCAIMSIPIPYIFRWNWETKYFGAGLIPFASGAIIGIYPILCIAFYSSLPSIIRITLVVLQTILINHWCTRFVNIYRKIYNNKILFYCIYKEEPTAVYYSQQADKKVINKLLKFEQFPSSKSFVLAFLCAFSLVPFATPLSKIAGIPFIHIFLAIGATPLNLMFLGLSTKMWLVYYFYPKKIIREINKQVYVDMSSRPPKFLRSLRKHKN
jgi:hypothetical protein